MKLEAGSTIAVVGASARAAAFSLLRAGYQVIAADLFADADLARVCQTTRITEYPEGFESWLSNTECDAWIYTGALENYPDLVDRLAVSRRLIGHAGAALRRVRDPLALQNALTEQRLHFPHTTLAEDRQPPTKQLAKTYAGSCGSGIGSNSTSENEACYWQEFVAGTSLSAVFRGQQLLGVTRQLVGEAWTGAGKFQYCGTIAPWPLEEQKMEQLVKLGQLLHSDFKLTEWYGVDLIDDGQRLWTIEVNPRYTAAMEVVERASCAGKVVLYAKAAINICASVHEWLLTQAGGLPWPVIADIPKAGTEIQIGQPILTVYAEGESCEAVEQHLRLRAAETEKRLYTKDQLPCG